MKAIKHTHWFWGTWYHCAECGQTLTPEDTRYVLTHPDNSRGGLLTDAHTCKYAGIKFVQPADEIELKPINPPTNHANE